MQPPCAYAGPALGQLERSCAHCHHVCAHSPGWQHAHATTPAPKQAGTVNISGGSRAGAGMCARLLGGFLHLPLQLYELAGAATAAVHAGEPRLQLLHLLAVLPVRHRLMHSRLQLRQLLVVLVQLLHRVIHISRFRTSTPKHQPSMHTVSNNDAPYAY